MSKESKKKSSKKISTKKIKNGKRQPKVKTLIEKMADDVADDIEKEVLKDIEVDLENLTNESVLPELKIDVKVETKPIVKILKVEKKVRTVRITLLTCSNYRVKKITFRKNCPVVITDPEIIKKVENNSSFSVIDIGGG